MEKITDLSFRVAKNFILHEVVRSQTASRLGIDNNLPAELLNNVEHTAQEILQPCRDHFGVPFSPSSFYRSPELNERIGGKSTSQHTKGEAVDFEIHSVSNYDLAKWIAHNIEFDQLILEYNIKGVPLSGWVHCSIKEKGNRKQVFRFDGKTYQLLPF